MAAASSAPDQPARDSANRNLSSLARSDSAAGTPSDGRQRVPRTSWGMFIVSWQLLLGTLAVAGLSALATAQFHERQGPPPAMPLAPAVQATIAPLPDATPPSSAPWQLQDPEPIYVEGEALQLRAIIRQPKVLSPGGQPLVLILHGTHGLFRTVEGPDRCPDPGGSQPPGSRRVHSAQGLIWLAERFAERGMVAVVVDASPMGCVFAAPGAYRRMEVGLGLIKRWAAWQKSGRGPLPNELVAAVDLSKVALVGHSSGAEAVAMLALQLAHPQRHGVDQVKVAGALLITPPDFLKVPHMPVPVAIWTASCDADVGGAKGDAMFARLSQLPGHPPMVLWSVDGAVHNAANTEWRDEVVDGAPAVCAPSAKMPMAAQRDLLGRVAVEWLAAMTGKTSAPGWVLGSGTPPSAAGGEAVRWRVNYQP